MSATAEQLRYGTAAGRRVLLATILASGMAFLDGTVVNVALPRIEDDLGGGFATIQWVLDSYLLTLGSLVLIGGALGDLLGKRRVFIWGIIGFAGTSLLCGLAPNAASLVSARAAQGVAAALMVPGSLAILSTVFVGEDRGKAIGAWSGLSGIVTALGPFVGGTLVDAHPSGWRAIFLINIPLAGVCLWLARGGIPELAGSRRPGSLRGQVDVTGGLLAFLGLALIVGPLIEYRRLGPVVAGALVTAGFAVLGAFVALEQRRERTQQPPPMMPPALFAIRSFSVANVQTFVVYGALGAVLLLFTIGLQIGLGWSALAAGAAGLPITVILALGSSRVGGLVPRIGSRPLLTAGPLVMAAGILWLGTTGPGDTYLWPIGPAIIVFSVGLVLIVAPITTTALGEIAAEESGVGSGVNNAIARIAGLVAVAVIPLLAGLTEVDSASGADVFPGFTRAALWCAGLCVAGALLAWFGFTRETGRIPELGQAPDNAAPRG